MPLKKGDGSGCLTPGQAKAGSVVFKGTGGAGTAGFYAGRGNTGIVLAHQADGNVCQWKDRALELGKEGFQALAVNSAGDDVAEVDGAAAHLRAKGAWKLILMGASKGGTAVVRAATVLEPRPDAVVWLSGPTEYGPDDALAAAPKLTSPVLYMAGAEDSPFGDAAVQLSRASTKAPGNRLHEPKGVYEHGVALLDDAKNWSTVLAFLKKYCI
ncbi:alpha/beta hydrolase family protein [Streptomyces sp. NPDC059994]|uniref:alpha/beta hydrolase family protein n=1 Tax=Streptomyces sp. NPDC059994 TaxID=3347029 RepID=UPI00369512CC